MFQTILPSINKGLNTVYTAIGNCHTSYVDCLLVRSEWNSLRIQDKSQYKIENISLERAEVSKFRKKLRSD
jgi:hypothetical protein